MILENSARSIKSSEPSEIDLNVKELKPPDLKKEYMDPLKAQTIQLKFVAFRTPKNITGQNIPERMYFTTQFYMF